MSSCTNCGFKNFRDAHYCASCGANLDDQSQTSIDATDVIPPRDLGQLISHTFVLYRQHFWPLVLIALFPEIFNVLAAFTPWEISILLLFGYFIASKIPSGAITYAVAQSYLGQPIYVGESYRKALNKAVYLVVGSILLFLALIASAILIVIIVGFALLFFLLVSWVFLGQAIMIEGDTPRSGLVRSYRLVKGSWWRVFGIGIVYSLILIGLGILVFIPSIIVGLVSDSAGATVSAILAVFITPIAPIGLTVVYIDLRSRKEGFTLSALSDQLSGTSE